MAVKIRAHARQRSPAVLDSRPRNLGTRSLLAGLGDDRRAARLQRRVAVLISVGGVCRPASPLPAISISTPAACAVSSASRTGIPTSEGTTTWLPISTTTVPPLRPARNRATLFLAPGLAFESACHFVSPSLSG